MQNAMRNEFGAPAVVDRSTFQAELDALRLREKAHTMRAMLLRQKSICDNQSHHARENQQCRERFSDHSPRLMIRSR